MDDSIILKAHPFDGEFIASIDFTPVCEKNNPLKSKLETVVILDQSGSMADSVYRIITEVLPKFFENLHYNPKTFIHLIAFEDITTLHTVKIEDMQKMNVHSMREDYMAPAVSELHKLVKDFYKKSVTCLRVLAISDGMIADPKDTNIMADKLAEYAGQCNISINSQAVRLFTSYTQPDTGALCSLLQLNNVEKSQLADVSASLDVEKMALEMSNLFDKDGFENAQFLESARAIFYKFPWDEEALEKLPLIPGHNVFWMKELPAEALKVNEKPVKIVIESNVTLEVIKSLLDEKMDFVIDRMKILKVINTENAKKIIEKMVEYYTRVENLLVELIPAADEFLDPKNIANRARILKLNAIRSKKITHFLSTIANDENVEKLNAAQKAAYLRSVDGASKAGRGLAMRASKKAKKKGIVSSVDETVRKQTLEMAAHFDEISDIDDKNHTVSFYSQATTLEGIRTLVDFTKDKSFNNLDANEILQIINIVGVACIGPIGDFPDASTWPITEVHVGCFVSVADIITAYIQAGNDGDKTLMAPGIDKKITNVIPVFDDPRIGVFLKNYAPSLLEFSSSIGMRRVIADVPMTFGYTVIAGIRKLVYDMNKNKSTAHVEAFTRIIETAAAFIGKYYDYIEDLLVEQKESGLNGYYLNNNGLATLIVPLIRAYKKKKELKIAEILRSVYSYEIWKQVGKEFKGKSNFLDMAKENLYKLLQIDLEKHQILPTALFEPEPDTINFYESYHIDQEYLDKVTQPLYYHNYMTLLPHFITAAVAGEDFKNIPIMSKDTIVTAFGIKYTYKEFIFLNVYQALRYPMKKHRIDNKEKRMKILDVKNRDEVIADIKAFVRSQFQGVYEKHLKEKKRKEQEILAAEFVETITKSTNITEVIASWREGITRNGVSYKLKNSSSPGFRDLSNALVNFNAEIPLRAEIILILLLGRDEKREIVYNNGEICGIGNVKKFMKRFLLTRSPDEWQKIQKKIKNRGAHVYREKVNRHNHGNDQKSYFGLGYMNLLNYFEKISKDHDFTLVNEYCAKHEKCCDSTNVYNAMRGVVPSKRRGGRGRRR